MPTVTYEQLLAETVPQVIKTAKEYTKIGARFAELVRKGRARSPEESRLMDLLGLLIADYDRRHSLPPYDSTPAERLRFLMEHCGKTPTDLLPIFGQRSQMNDVLNGSG